MKTASLIIWSLLISLGFWMLFKYANDPGVAANKIDWPNSSSLVKNPKGPTLVMFLHTQCPCSKASVSELNKILPKITGKAKVMVAFYKPRGEKEEWVTKSDLWQSIASKDVEKIIDDQGQEADIFGSKTSGQTFLFNESGETVFQGGITQSRGHQGDSVGKESILNYLSQSSTKHELTSVFGCSIKNPERAKNEK